MSPRAPVAPSRSSFLLPRALKERKDKEGSFSALERAIHFANKADPTRDPRAKTTIDRRKLKLLVAGDPSVSLCAAEFQILDRYLEPFGYGLSWVPIFEKPNLMRALADSGRVTFLLAERRDKDIGYFSNSDVLAMAALQRGIGASGQHVLLDIEAVPLYEQQWEARECARFGDWTGEDHQVGEKGPSFVSLGSNRSLPASEGLQARMFGCEPFADAVREEKYRLPFHFVWSETLPYVFDSHFHLKPSDIAERDFKGAAAIEAGDASALVTRDKIFIDRFHLDQHGPTYALCAAQRRRGGQIWLVLAGVTGAATLAAARVASRLVTGLDQDRRDEHSGVHWAVVKAEVEKGSDGDPGIGRKFSSEEIVAADRWDPNA